MVLFVRQINTSILPSISSGIEILEEKQLSDAAQKWLDQKRLREVRTQVLMHNDDFAWCSVSKASRERNKSESEDKSTAADLTLFPVGDVDSLDDGPERENNDSPGTTEMETGGEELIHDNQDTDQDNVRLWESGSKERYYLHKFQVQFVATCLCMKVLSYVIHTFFCVDSRF